MKNYYRLIRLKADTVHELKKLSSDMGRASLDDLLLAMVRIVRDHRRELANAGWRVGEVRP